MTRLLILAATLSLSLSPVALVVYAGSQEVHKALQLERAAAEVAAAAADREAFAQAGEFPAEVR